MQKNPRFKPKQVAKLKAEISENSATLLQQLYTQLLVINNMVDAANADCLWDYQWQELRQRRAVSKSKKVRVAQAINTIQITTTQLQTFDDLVTFQQKILAVAGVQRAPIRAANMYVYYPRVAQRRWRAPAQVTLPKLIEELDILLRSKEDKGNPLLRVSLIHYLILTIHPFCDGNGRTSRLALPYLLPNQLHFRLQGSNHYFKDSEFYKLIAEVSASGFTGDINVWIQGWVTLMQNYFASLQDVFERLYRSN